MQPPVSNGHFVYRTGLGEEHPNLPAVAVPLDGGPVREQVPVVVIAATLVGDGDALEEVAGRAVGRDPGLDAAVSGCVRCGVGLGETYGRRSGERAQGED